MLPSVVTPRICHFVSRIYLGQNDPEDAFKAAFPSPADNLELAPPVLINSDKAIGMAFGPISSKPWGVPVLPNCPRCQGEDKLIELVPKAKTSVNHRQSIKDRVKASCLDCGLHSKIRRPDWVTEMETPANVFLFPFPPPVPELFPMSYLPDDAAAEMGSKRKFQIDDGEPGDRRQKKQKRRRGGKNKCPESDRV